MGIVNKGFLNFSIFFIFFLLFSCFHSVLSQPSNFSLFSNNNAEEFYVGVTYCGDNVTEAKQLIDKVKHYTNLFVIQSGSLQYGHRQEDLKQIIDYAVNSNLFFIVYFSEYSSFLEDYYEIFDSRWANYSLGVYFGDEPGGKMLDGERTLLDKETSNQIKKLADGQIITIAKIDAKNVTITYYPDSRIELSTFGLSNIFNEETNDYDVTLTYQWFTYFANGTIIIEISQQHNGPHTIVDNIENSLTYDELLNMQPFRTYDEASTKFVYTLERNLECVIENPYQLKAFTSDYAFYWFDYLAGYDVVFTQVGWNHTLAQDIALVRGAANLQNKDWGAIITWKYNHPPFLDTGEAIYDQMKTAYESGAKYVIVFNYAENMSSTNGILQEEHFEAIENFWDEVVQNPEIKQGSVKADAVLILPENYGWGMRYPEDKIWGIWEPDEISEQIWKLKTSLIEEYNLKLDIVYNDTDFPVEDKYSNIFYTFEDKTDIFSPILVVIAFSILIGIAAAIWYFKLKN